MLGAPWFYEMDRRAAEAELQQEIAELDGKYQRLEARQTESCHRLENVRLRAENARLKGDKQSAARLEVEAMSLEVELESLERQSAQTRKQIKKLSEKLECRNPMLDMMFWSTL